MATEKLEDRTLLSGQDLIAFAQALSAANVTLYGAAWDADTTAQRALLEDGAQYLQFVDVTNSDRSLNATLAAEAGITAGNVRPVWVLDNGTPIEGSTITTLEELATATGVAIPMGSNPYLTEIADQTLISNTGLHVALDGYDPENGDLTYLDPLSSNSGISARILTGNRSLRISVAGYGDMVFELFEDRASRATSQIIALAEAGFYDSNEFHRLFEGFLRGGFGEIDPEALPAGAQLPLNDQYNNELQHVQSGLLTLYKPPGVPDDSNFSQFIITEGAARYYDFQNTIFGFLVEGEDVRAALSQIPETDGVPDFTITMETVEVFEDKENATLFLNANEGFMGTSTITVIAEDEQGNQVQQQFVVTAVDDEINGLEEPQNARPYLADIPSLQGLPGDVLTYDLVAIDADLGATGGNLDYQFYSSGKLIQLGLPVPASIPSGMVVSLNKDTGALQVTTSPSLEFGVYQLTVAVGFTEQTLAGAPFNSFTSDELLPYFDYQVITIVLNDPSFANDDFYTLNGDTPDAMHVLENDYTSSGDLLFENDVLLEGYTVEIVDQPEHGGMVSVNPDGASVSFVTNGSDYIGVDRFTYRVKDSLGAYSEIATVDFTIAPENTILVTSLLTSDSNPKTMTLEEAILAANTNTAGGDPETIMFDIGLFTNSETSELESRTIHLRGGGQHLLISDDLIIIAPTAENGDPLLTLDATTSQGSSSRHFLVDDGTATEIFVSLQNLILIEGEAMDDGGSISNAEHLVLSNSRLLNNGTVSGMGGAIYNTGTLEINDSVLQMNLSNSYGGTIASSMGSVTITGTLIDDNNAEGGGAGIYASMTDVTVIDSVISNNESFAAQGAGIFQTQGTLTITGSSLINNSTGSTMDGGGVYVNDVTTAITGSTFHMNRGAGSGGGLYQNLGDLSIHSSTFSENEAEFGHGGGIYSRGETISIINSTISGNSAVENGGGLIVLDHNDFVSLTIDSSTIAANHTEGNGGGIYAPFIALTANNSIFADNTVGGAGVDAVGEFYGSYSLIENVDNQNVPGLTGFFISGSDYITGQDPGLLPLSDYGGATQTHALASGSVAIDAGDPSFDSDAYTPSLDLDQRGSERVADGNNDTTSRIDIGAYEASAVQGSSDLTVKWSETNTGGDGEVGSLPANAEFLDEWNPVIVEIWVSVTDSPEAGVASATVDFNFDSQYLVADSIEYGFGFTENQTGVINNETGVITGLGAATNLTDHGADTLVLLARVRLSVKQIPLNADDQYIEPVADLDFHISNSAILSSVGSATVTEGSAVNLTLVPALYDLNDNGKVDFRDLTLFASVYNRSVGDPNAPEAWAADFDRSGTVNFRDLVLFAANYQKVQGSGALFIYPANFDEVWQQNFLVTSTSVEESSSTQGLTQKQAKPVLDAAKTKLVETYGESAAESLADVKIEIVELPENQLAKANSETNTIYLDASAAGWGWFVDATPFLNEEFSSSALGQFDADFFGPAAGQIDLLTVLLHELSHLLGEEHDEASPLMQPTLEPGERKLPTLEEADEFFSGYLDTGFEGI